MEIRDRINKFPIVLLLLLIPSLGWATDYYVRPSGGSYGLEDGTSYANAWDGFSNINWTTVDSGNGQLFVAGTHSEALTIPGSADGESGAHIQVVSCTTAKGASTDDPGTISNITTLNNSGAVQIGGDYVTIDGLTIDSNSGSPGNGNGIDVFGTIANEILIKNCTIKDNESCGIYVHGQGLTGEVVIEYNTVYSNNESTDTHGQGFLSENTSAPIIIRYNTFEENGYNHPGEFNHNIYQDYSSTGGIDIYGNKILNAPDATNIKLKNSARVYNNFIAGSNQQGILHVEYDGVTATQYVYNNVFVGSGKGAVGNVREGATGNLTVHIYNNSFYENGVNQSYTADIFFYDYGIENLYIKNNAIYARSVNYCMRIERQPGYAEIDNNWCYGPSSNDKYNYLGVGKTLAEWRALGFDRNGNYADPEFNNPTSDDLSLRSTSPCIDEGENLGADYDNTLTENSSWPDSVSTSDQDEYTPWEVGSYVYGSSSSGTPPEAPTGLSVIGSQ